MSQATRAQVRLPIRLTTGADGAIVGVERPGKLPSRQQDERDPRPLKLWRADHILDDERLQACETAEMLVPSDRLGLVFEALCETARRQSRGARFVEFDSWRAYHDSVHAHSETPGVH